NRLRRLLPNAERRCTALGEQARHEALTFRDPFDLNRDRVNGLLEALHALVRFGRRSRGRLPAASEDIARHSDRDWEANEDRADNRDGGYLPRPETKGPKKLRVGG